VVVTVMMPPLPILSLLVAVELAILAVRIAVSLDHLLIVKNNFVVIPVMVIVVIGS
jgi:hypothetical protein